ncbi:MAG TPA: hypothetical protein VFS00_17190, partial [Polyangiaceae bacterium]|nr:hypothetical protein [Polyangiaceae bacterium]
IVPERDLGALFRARRRQHETARALDDDDVGDLAGTDVADADLDRLVEAGRVAEALLGRRLPGKVHQAGVRSLRA